MLGGTGPDPSAARPESLDVDWLDRRIRNKVNLIFNTYLIGKSASDLVALAERVEQEATGPEDREKVNCSNCGRESSSQHRFCTYCGRVLKPAEVMPAAIWSREKVNCSNCGRESSSQHRFCTHCGTELKPVEVMTAASAGGATGWMAPVPDYGDWDWDPGSGGGDWSA